MTKSALSQSEEISSDFCCFYGGGIRHNEDIMHSFQNFIVRLIPNHPPPLETRIWKLVVRALVTKCRAGFATGGLAYARQVKKSKSRSDSVIVLYDSPSIN